MGSNKSTLMEQQVNNEERAERPLAKKVSHFASRIIGFLKGQKRKDSAVVPPRRPRYRPELTAEFSRFVDFAERTYAENSKGKKSVYKRPLEFELIWIARMYCKALNIRGTEKRNFLALVRREASAMAA